MNQSPEPVSVSGVLIPHPAKVTQKLRKSVKTNAKVTHIPPGSVTTKEAAAVLGVSHDTVTRWCASGKLLAHPVAYGDKTSYRVPLASVLMLKQQQEALPAMAKEKKRGRPKARTPHKTHLKGFQRALERGTLWGRPLSAATVADYCKRVVDYLKERPALGAIGVRDTLQAVPAHQFATREHIYRALVAFGKYLIDQDALPSGFLDDVKAYRPKKNPTPQRVRVAPDALERMLAVALGVDGHLINLIANTGLRSAEACALDVEDIDTAGGVLVVQRGKGGKARRVGLNAAAMNALAGLIEDRTTGPVLLNRKLERMDPDGVYQRIARVAAMAGVRATVHSLRRYFITSNAAQGRPITFIQRAAGHSNITTTRLYVLETEAEVVEAMKGWTV